MNDNMNSPSKRTAKRFGFLMIAVTLGSGWLTVVESVGQEPALSALTQTIDSSDIGKRDSRSNVRKEKFRKRESRSASRKKERGRIGPHNQTALGSTAPFQSPGATLKS